MAAQSMDEPPFVFESPFAPVLASELAPAGILEALPLRPVGLRAGAGARCILAVVILAARALLEELGDPAQIGRELGPIAGGARSCAAGPRACAGPHDAC